MSDKPPAGKSKLPQGTRSTRIHVSLPKRYLDKLAERPELGRAEQIRRGLDALWGWDAKPLFVKPPPSA